MQRFVQQCVCGLGLGLLLVVSVASVDAQSLEERVDKLEKKFSLTKGISESLPEWVNRLTFKGDLRLRYQYQKEDGDDDARHRGRFRYRLGVNAKIAENLKVGFGIASGGDDSRSTNQTLDDNFSSKSVRIDLAYAEYKPVKWLKIVGGKFSNPIWRPSDLLWDSDIRTEGGAIALKYKALDTLVLFAGTSVFVLEENGGGADPLLVPMQGGVDVVLAKKVNFRLAVTYYEFVDVEGTTLDNSAETNTLTADDVLRYDYDAVSVGGEIGMKKPFGDVLPYIGLFGEYVYSFDPDEDNEGFLVGAKFGDKRVSKGGQWQVKYLYRRLERDAWPDAYPDSDFFAGGTGFEGHEVIVVYGIVKNVQVGIDYYHTDEIDGAAEEDLFQFDVILKF